MGGNYEARKRNLLSLDSYVDSPSVPPSAFTTFHLGILTNAGCLRDDVRVSCGATLLPLIPLTAEHNPIVQGILQHFVWARPRSAGRFELYHQELELDDIRRILQEPLPTRLRYEPLYWSITTQTVGCLAQGLVNSCRGVWCGLHESTWREGTFAHRTISPPADRRMFIRTSTTNFGSRG